MYKRQVWKAIDSPRRDGYTIEARKAQGYRLVAAPDALVEREIRQHLAADISCPEPVSYTHLDVYKRQV